MEDTEARDMADAGDLHVAMDAIVTALDALRSGRLRLDKTRDPGTLSTISTALYQMTCRLAPRLQGALDALIRAHYAAGGSHAELARAMEVERSTAQARGDRVRKATPTHWELWAAGELEPQTRPAAEVRPGWTLVVDDQHLQVVRVVHHLDSGHVSITTGGGGTISHTAEAPVLVIPREVPIQTIGGEERLPDGTAADVEIHERAYLI